MKTIKYIIILIFSLIFTQSYSQDVTSGDSTLLNYAFKDLKGKTVRLSDFKGKLIFIDIWYSGCGFCISANKALKVVHRKLKDQNIVFLSVSIDSNKTKWIESITPGAKPSKLNPWAGKYAPEKGTVILYTGGTGSNNEFIKRYVPNDTYPKLLLFSQSGKLISDRPPRPDSYPKDVPEKLIAYISNYLMEEK